MPTLAIPNTFTAGTDAIAAEVNANFDAIATLLNTTKLDAANLQDGAVTTAKIASNAVGAGAIGSLPAARVFHSAAQTVASATNKTLAFNSERFDTDTIHDTVTNNSRLTATTAGVYVITASVRWAQQANTARAILFVVLNGTTTIATQAESMGDAEFDVDQSVTTVYKLAATDYVEAIVHTTDSSGGTIETLGNLSPEFSMTWVGDG